MEVYKRPVRKCLHFLGTPTGFDRLTSSYANTEETLSSGGSATNVETEKLSAEKLCTAVTAEPPRRSSGAVEAD